MKIMIEFYRTRDADNAHAVVGRETSEAIDLVGAIGIGRALSLTHAAVSRLHVDNRR
jgi:hypothetical protein